MTAPSSGFGTNAVGGSAAPCPLGNLNYEVLQRHDQRPPVCAVRIFIDGPKTLDGTVPQGFKQGGFLHIEPGTYTVGVLPDDAFVDRYELPEQQHAVVPKSGTATVKLLLDVLAEVVVKVARTDGKPVGGEVPVTLTRSPDRVGRDRTTASGTAKFEQVRAGTYTVSVTLPPELATAYAVPASGSVTVAAGATPAPVEIRLTPLPWLGITLVSEDGTPIKGFTAAIRGPTGAPARATSSDGAPLRFDGLPAGDGACAVDEVAVADQVLEFVKLSTGR